MGTKSSARRQEIAVRLSIGASRSRLIRQLLTESVLLSLAGGVAGLLIAYWARAVLWALRPPFMQANFIDLDVDGRVLAFAGIASPLTGIVFGLVPVARGAGQCRAVPAQSRERAADSAGL